MDKYVLISKVKKQAKDVEWWMEQTEDVENSVKIFDSFDEAKVAMRKKIKKIATTCDFFPLENGFYTPLDDFLDRHNFVSKTIKNIIMNNYNAEEIKNLNYQDTNDCDDYVAIFAKPDQIIVDIYDQRLTMNIHNDTNPNKNYYFYFAEFYEDTSEVLNEISITLLKTNYNANKN